MKTECMKLLLCFVLVSFFLAFATIGGYANNRFGLQTGFGSIKEEAKYLNELGIGIIRLPLPWQLVEPKQGVFDWSLTDRLVKEANKKDIEVLFVLRVLSPWGSKEAVGKKGIYRTASPPKDMKAWVRFVEAVASRYKGRGVHYGIENEVNGTAFWSGTIEEYTDLLKTSFTVIKKVDPSAMVLSSAMGCGITRDITSQSQGKEALLNHDKWLKAILATKSFDVVDIHNYYFPDGATANGLTFNSYLEHIKQLMKSEGVADKKIWITETGFVSASTQVGRRLDAGSPEKQAEQLEKAYVQANAAGVERVFWLLLKDRREPYFGTMGLSDIRGNRRPAWFVHERLAKSRSR